MKLLIALTLLSQIGCTGLTNYVLITAGTFSGEVLADKYEDSKKEKENDKKD